MSAEQNLAATRRFIEEVWNQGDLEVIDRLCASNCVDHDLSMHEEIKGLDEAKERVRRYRTAMPDLRVSIDDIFASEDEVLTRWTARGTNEGELMGNPPTHRRTEFTGMTVDRFDAEGKVVEVWDQWDSLTFMQQVGMAPSAAAAGAAAAAAAPPGPRERWERDFAQGGRNPSPEQRWERDFAQGGRNPSPRERWESDFAQGGRNPSPEERWESDFAQGGRGPSPEERWEGDFAQGGRGPSPEERWESDHTERRGEKGEPGGPTERK